MESKYPVYFQYGTYSVRLSELSDTMLDEIRAALKPLDIELVYKGRTH